MTISKKIYKLVAVTAVAAMALTGAALATDEVDFSVECPKLRGSVNTIEEGFYGEKETTGSSLYVYDCGVGGGYQVDARQIDSEVQLVLGKLATGRASLACTSTARPESGPAIRSVSNSGAQ